MLDDTIAQNQKPENSASRRPFSKKTLFVFAAAVLAIGIGIGVGAILLGGPLWEGVAQGVSRSRDSVLNAYRSAFHARVPAPVVSDAPRRAERSYQAVFLSNGQVYFGKVVDEREDPVVLRDVYYLQVTQQLQPAPGSKDPSQSVPQISLIKLGNELHAPTDEMRISRAQVLFIEDLKDESPVVKAIREFRG